MASGDEDNATKEGTGSTASGGDSETKAAAPATDESNANAEAAPASNGDATNTKDDDPRPSDKSQPSAKKRRSNMQLNKDDHPEGVCNSDEDDELNEEGGKRSDPFKKASDDVLKKRKIVKASNKWSSGGNGGASGGGAFASVKLAHAAGAEKVAKIPTFGSAAGSSGFGGATTKSGGFGSGFGGVSSGFGALKSSSSADKADAKNGDAKTSAFGGGFGAVSSGFGSLKSSTKTGFGFGSASDANATSPPTTADATNNASGLAGTFAQSPNKSSASPSKFPTSSVVDTANGEQDEDCLCQVRAKLFKMVPEDEAFANAEDSNASKGAVLSVPSSSGRMKLVKAKTDDKDASPDKSAESPEKSNEPNLVQKEAGIGPVRVLKRKSPIILGESKKEEAAKEPTSARVVQRQETCSGGSTKVILNIRLIPKTCNVIRRGDKFVQLNSPNSDGTMESSLFKVKTTAEGDILEKNLKAMLGVEVKDA